MVMTSMSSFGAADKRGRLRLVASPDAADGSVLIHQDARVYASLLDARDEAALDVDERRRIYVHVVRGAVTAQGTELAAGDALMLSDTKRVDLSRADDAEVLVFDLP
jgi:quercetin 2,3-dioxygenase